MKDKEKVECYCEVCDEKIIGVTRWMKHIYTDKHTGNAFKELREIMSDGTMKRVI